VLTDQFAEIDPDAVCERYFSSGADDSNVLSLGFATSGYFFAEHKKIAENFTDNFATFGLVQMT
jgi:hypothetical protein